MPNWLLRAATPGDAPALSILGKQTFRETFFHYSEADLTKYLDTYYSVDVFSRYLNDPQIQIWVVEQNNELIGNAQLGAYKLPLVPTSLPVVELHRLYVLKTFHGQKIGDALIKRTLETVQLQGAQSLYLGVWEGNKNAQDFYAHYGFKKVGEYDYPPIGKIVDREWILRKEIR